MSVAVQTEPTRAEELAALLQRCAGGDRAAFRRLYDLAAPQLHGVALRITRQASLASDAVQDAFVQAWQEAHRFDAERGSAAAWLTALVRYRSLDLVRRRSRDVLGYEPQDVADNTPDALAGLVGTAEADALRRCLDGLDADRRRLLLLSYADGLSHSDLATRLGEPLGTVKSWIRRSLIALRTCLEP